jgi:hypothetical protein
MSDSRGGSESGPQAAATSAHTNMTSVQMTTRRRFE